MILFINMDFPEECKEAIPSLIYAATRFSDMSELNDLKTLFAAKFGALEPNLSKEGAARERQRSAESDEERRRSAEEHSRQELNLCSGGSCGLRMRKLAKKRVETAAMEAALNLCSGGGKEKA
ncbi:hypothetical protein PIB30_024292 [Stylosanthes scabra]|uniref:Uncharacterized protein n=1 Tax=Stylosanthes scabra TaxID=79078 RepID=A0ABU6X7T2_9FABA|nr:hypothetical protein [Stylosanthes scabra]